ncbi:MAG: ArsC/Spx/MgsR family protein [Pseudomonadota bacterium]
MQIEIVGLNACDTCKKAQKALTTAGYNAQISDVRVHPLGAERLQGLYDLFGEKLVNTRSTTWRGLSDHDRGRPHLSLLEEYPALMKRPVVTDGTSTTLGWSADVQAVWGL